MMRSIPGGGGWLELAPSNCVLPSSHGGGRNGRMARTVLPHTQVGEGCFSGGGVVNYEKKWKRKTHLYTRFNLYKHLTDIKCSYSNSINFILLS